MKYHLRYLGRSSVSAASWGTALSLAPNLARSKVFFDAELADPVRFREAVSALHDVVVGDLKYKPKDRTQYREWLESQERGEAELRRQVTAEAKKDALAKLAGDVPPPNLEADFRRMHALYWRARRSWANELAKEDPEMWRHLVPCDPVVTVAPDAVLFEAFSKDESSYGCLSVDRNSFKDDRGAGLGTTNVDYSIALYEHFQTLRTYRPTRFVVDPSGFEVNVEGRADYREEKIDLPTSWLRGFGQLQAAMLLPSRRVTLPVETVYSLLAWLVRHREKTGPRSIRFRLTPGRAPEIFLEPWNQQITCAGPVWQGERAEEIKVWGRRRLMALARVLPLADRVEVRLLGSGLPSLWVAHMGDMRFTLALSGWTTNDWTGAASLELLAGDGRADAETIAQVESVLADVRTATMPVIAKAVTAPRSDVASALHELAKRGQVMYDFASQSYRFRPVMPVALSESVLGPEPEEVREGRRLAREGRVKVQRDEKVSASRRLVVAQVEKTECEALFDADHAMGRAKCTCSWFRTKGLRAGPCRHLLALRLAAGTPAQGATAEWLN